MSQQVQKPKWAVKFNVDDNVWEKLTLAAAAKGCSPLELALDSGIIDESALLTSERENTKIPVLKSDFFNSSPPLELLKKFDYQKYRLLGCIPVTDWNGTIYSAKLSSEPSELETEKSKSLWFLAPWSGMKKWYSVWENSLGIKPTQIIPQEMISPTPVNTVTSVAPAPQDVVMAPPVPEEAEEEANAFEFGFVPDVNTGSQSVNTEVTSQSSLSLVDIPSDTLQPTATNFPNEIEVDFGEAPSQESILELPSETLQTIEPAVEIPKPATPPTAPELELDLGSLNLETPQPQTAPTELSFLTQDLPAGLAPQVNEKGLDLDFSSLLGGIATETSSISMAPAPVAAPAPTPIQAPEVLFVEEEIIPKKIEAPIPMPKPEGEKHSVTDFVLVAPKASKDIPTVPPNQFESRLKLAHDQDGVAEVMMGVWQSYFDQVMILLFQQDKLIVWWNNNKFINKVNRGEIVLLEGPSIFKIVCDTENPYHGYVTHSPINDRFFHMANGGQYPEHATIIPVMADDRVVAMLFGACTSELAKSLILPKLEEDAKTFANSLFKISNERQAG